MSTSTPEPAGNAPGILPVPEESVRGLLERLLQDAVVEKDRRQATSADEQVLATALRERIGAEHAANSLARSSRSAERDSLTQLPNNVLLLDRCAQAAAVARRDGGRFAVLYLDINQFSRVNARFGREAGDEVLRLAARRLVTAAGDAHTVSRQDGDEFVVLATGLAKPSDAARLASVLVTALAAPTLREGLVLRLTASIGISLYPDDGGDGEQLVQAALTAMQRAKRLGQGTFAFHGRPAALQEALPLPPPAVVKVPIMPRKAALADLARRQAQLDEENRKLALVALDARALNEAAKRARQRQGTFLGLVAAELANPLAPIRVAAAMLGGPRVEQSLMPKAKGIIEEQVARMGHVLDALQEVSDAGSFELGPAKRRLDLVHVVNAAIESCRSAMDARMQAFTVALPQGGFHVRGDAARLRQVVRNLLANASTYTPDFGRIHLSLEATGEDLVLEVSDNGVGITSLALESLFEPFVQDMHALGFNGVGVGIGLAVVRALVEAHGGTVSAASEGRGRGSRFTVRLPRAASPPT